MPLLLTGFMTSKNLALNLHEHILIHIRGSTLAILRKEDDCTLVVKLAPQLSYIIWKLRTKRFVTFTLWPHSANVRLGDMRAMPKPGRNVSKACKYAYAHACRMHSMQPQLHDIANIAPLL